LYSQIFFSSDFFYFYDASNERRVDIAIAFVFVWGDKSMISEEKKKEKHFMFNFMFQSKVLPAFTRGNNE